MAKTNANLYRHFTETPRIISALDQKKFTKYELTRFLRVKYDNFRRLFTNPLKHLKFHHMVRISYVTGIPIGKVAELFLKDMSNPHDYKKIFAKDLDAARVEAEKNYQFAAKHYIKVKKMANGELEDIDNAWDYETD